MPPTLGEVQPAGSTGLDRVHTALLAKPSLAVYWTLVQYTVRPFFLRKELDQQGAARQEKCIFLRCRDESLRLLESDYFCYLSCLL